MKFREAIRNATFQAMEGDPNVILMGVGIIDPRAVWGTLSGTLEKFGPDRVVEGPLAEDAITGMCIGAATLGIRSIMVHHRIDFVLLTMNQLINHAAKWRDMFGQQQHVPIVIRAVVGRGWGNGPQHTQSHHALYSHVPGIKTVVPTNAYDAKGLLLAAIEDDEPVVYIEHRWFHEDEGEVPEAYYLTPIGKAAVIREGTDVSLVAVGPMVPECQKAAQALAEEGISAEVIDVRTTHPLDVETIVKSVAKTGRLVVADSDWGPCGVAGEVIAAVTERAFDALKAAPVRIVWPHICVPSSQSIEALFYPGAAEIQAAALKVCSQMQRRALVESTIKGLDGPF
ncbi:MAG: transketolase C-terminal domain-containing protein [Leptolyngbyaceae cyanobacterium bins.59]|nr:transketolase C-terminal domain-containing protein [Leptolyngbyaceae cyanobacterium bins.59]